MNANCVFKIENKNRGFKTMQMCKTIIKINKHLKVLRNETDMECAVLEGPTEELIVTGFSPNHNS